MSISGSETAGGWGTVPQMQQKLPERSLGFRGPPLPSKGHPVPSWLCSRLRDEQDWCFSGIFPGGAGQGLSALRQLQWHWNKWVGKEQLGGAEEHPQVSQMQSGVRLLSCKSWSPHMQGCLFIHKKYDFLTRLCAFPFADGWRKGWSSDCQEPGEEF